jgi:hypothetical protein
MSMPVSNFTRKNVTALPSNFVGVDLGEIGWEGVDWMHLTQDGY